MATTQVLEESYWPGQRQERSVLLKYAVTRRWFRVPRVEYDNLKPAIADTAYGDTTMIVGAVGWVERGVGENDIFMVVTYIDTTSDAIANGYAETRRVKRAGQYTVDYAVYGIATSATAAGIPAVGDVLDYSVWAAGPAYSVGAIVQGDGTPDSYFYECISVSTNNEPPNVTYWKRAILNPRCHAVDSDDQELAGLWVVTSRFRQERAYA